MFKWVVIGERKDFYEKTADLCHWRRGGEKPESIYPDAQPQDAPEQDGVSAPAEAESVEHPAEPDGEDVSSL